MLEAAAASEEQVAALERRVTGRDLELRGTLRVTTTDTIAMSFGPRHIAAFHAAYPGIVVELSAVTERVSLSRRAADVAIDRKSVGEGKRVAVRVDLGGRRINKKKKEQ